MNNGGCHANATCRSADTLGDPLICSCHGGFSPYETGRCVDNTGGDGADGGYGGDMGGNGGEGGNMGGCDAMSCPDNRICDDSSGLPTCVCNDGFVMIGSAGCT